MCSRLKSKSIKMDIKRQKAVYPTAAQKKKLVAFMTQYPQLVSLKLLKATEGYSHADSRLLWNKIATECNAIPGAKKTWRQWRKTWQDIKAKAKKKQQVKKDEVPLSVSELLLLEAENDVLALKNVSSTTNYQESVEFVAPEDDLGSSSETKDVEFNDTVFSDPSSPIETNVDILATPQFNVKKTKTKTSQNNADNCSFNCDRLVDQDERKIQLKEDYLNFKKDYLRQKLLLMKEQTEALKNIAKELAK